MSENDWENDNWQLGMTLPSRKETHSKKKKKRKPEKASKDKGKSKKEKAFAEEQVNEEQQVDGKEQATRSEQVPAVSEPKSQPASLPVVPAPAQSQPKNPPDPQAPKTDTAWQADNLVRAVQSFEAVPELESAKAIPVYQEQTPEQEAARTELEQAEAETAVGAAALDFPLQQSFPVFDHEQVEPDATALPADPAQPGEEADVEADAEAEEEEVQPVIGKWQRRFLLTITPILVLITLLYGKIGYVHQIPDIVRKNVPAYAEGEGFLIVKPWWFGPPVIALDQMGNPQADSFEIYKATLSDYEGVLEKPWVLRTYPQDLFQK